MKLTKLTPSRRRGQGMTEYIIIIAIVAIGAILVVGIFGQQIKTTFARIASALTGSEEDAGDAGDAVEDSEARDDMGDFSDGSEGN